MQLPKQCLWKNVVLLNFCLCVYVRWQTSCHFSRTDWLSLMKICREEVLKVSKSRYRRDLWIQDRTKIGRRGSLIFWQTSSDCLACHIFKPCMDVFEYSSVIFDIKIYDLEKHSSCFADVLWWKWTSFYKSADYRTETHHAHYTFVYCTQVTRYDSFGPLSQGFVSYPKGKTTNLIWTESFPSIDAS